MPAERVDAGEDLGTAAAREVLEETGWRAGPLSQRASWNPENGLSDQVFTYFLAQGATYEGEPSDLSESERVAWVPLLEVRRLAASGEVVDGLSLTALSHWLAFPS